MGLAVLTSQFVSGLHRELKTKLTGVQGNMEQLLLKARFKKAKLKELAMQRSERIGGEISWHPTEIRK